MTRRSGIAAFGSAGVLVLVGAVSDVLSNGTLGQVIAQILIGVGLVLAISLAFSRLA
jgi:uncharacterized membrane protein